MHGFLFSTWYSIWSSTALRASAGLCFAGECGRAGATRPFPPTAAFLGGRRRCHHWTMAMARMGPWPFTSTKAPPGGWRYVLLARHSHPPSVSSVTLNLVRRNLRHLRPSLRGSLYFIPWPAKPWQLACANMRLQETWPILNVPFAQKSGALLSDLLPLGRIP